MFIPKNVLSFSRVTSFQASPSVPAALFLCAFSVIINNKFHTWWSQNSSKYSRALVYLLSPHPGGSTALVNCFKFLLVFSSNQAYCHHLGSWLLGSPPLLPLALTTPWPLLRPHALPMVSPSCLDLFCRCSLTYSRWSTSLSLNSHSLSDKEGLLPELWSIHRGNHSK